MTLIKTALLNGIAVIIKMLTLLGINKILAIYVGPAGYAYIGQFQNAVQMVTTFASGAINTGVIKYTAEYCDDEPKQVKIWRTAGSIALIGSLATSLFIALFNQNLAIWILNDIMYGSVFLWFAASLSFFTFNTLLLAILNGKKEIALYVLANVSGSIFALVVTALMAIQFGLYGALVALAVYQSISFFVTLMICYRLPWFKVGHLLGEIDANTVFDLAKYTGMALTSAVCVPVSHILVRNQLGETFGWNFAGYWEAMWRLSSAYLMLFTTTLGVYYLPKLSGLFNTIEIKNEIKQAYKIVLPVTILFGLFVYLLRDQIVNLLFTEDFTPMRQLFAWQLIGDTLKIGGWILSYFMLSKAMYKMFIITEIIFSSGFVVFNWFFSKYFGFEGVAMAHAATYATYWVTLSILILPKINELNEKIKPT